jgi:hypothetical protein
VFTLLSQETFDPKYTLSLHRHGGVMAAFAALPALWPYALSFAMSRSVVPARAAYVVIYAAVVAIATVTGIWFVLYPPDGLGSVGSAFLIGLLQAVGFAMAAQIIHSHADRHGAAY